MEVDGSLRGQAQEYDQRRTKCLESLGFRLLRFWNTDVLTNLEGVLAAIPRPYLPPQLRGGRDQRTPGAGFLSPSETHNAA